MSSNPCSHDLANCHAKEPRYHHHHHHQHHAYMHACVVQRGVTVWQRVLKRSGKHF